MSDQANTPIVLPPVSATDAWYFNYMGRAALAIDPRPRLKKFAVVDGDRRWFGEKTPRPALNLKIIRKETELCRSPS